MLRSQNPLIKTSSPHFQAGMHAARMRIIETTVSKDQLENVTITAAENYVALYKLVNGVYPPDGTKRSYKAGFIQAFNLHDREVRKDN